MKHKIVESIMSAIRKLRCVSGAHVAAIGLTALLSASVGAAAVSLTERPGVISAAQSNPPDPETSIANDCHPAKADEPAGAAVVLAAHCASAAEEMARLYRRVELLATSPRTSHAGYNMLVDWVFHPDWTEFVLLPTAASLAAGGVLRYPSGRIYHYPTPAGQTPQHGGQAK